MELSDSVISKLEIAHNSIEKALDELDGDAEDNPVVDSLINCLFELDCLLGKG